MDATTGRVTAEDLLAETVWLRRLARRIASQMDLAEDAVQETLLAGLRGGPRAGGNLRGWLAAVLRNALRRRARHERRLAAREEAWAQCAERVRSVPLDISERFALEHDLSKAVLALDTDLRRLVLLRFLEGRSLREIADEVNAPISTVDARLSRALALLRQQLERSHGEGNEGPARLRALLLLYLGPHRTRASTGSAVPFIAGAALTVVGGVVWFVASAAPSSWVPSVEGDAGALSPLAGGGDGDSTSLVPAGAATTSARRALREPPANTTSTLTGRAEVRLLDEAHRPLVGASVALWPAVSEHVAPLPQITDKEGQARFDGLSPGTYWVTTERRLPSALEVVAGEPSRVSYVAEGPALAGIVVDEFGAPVPDALVWIAAAPGGAFRDGSWTRGVLEDIATARSDGHGRFSVPGGGEVRLAGARATGRSPTTPVRLRRERDATAQLVLEFSGVGGGVHGRVLDAEGAPAAGVLVCVEAFEESDPTWPLLASRTDAAGEFRFEGLAVGERAVTVRAPGHAPWRATACVNAAAAARLDVRLARGARLEGTVRDAEGDPLANAELRCTQVDQTSEPWMVAGICARSATNGAYVLDGLPPAALSLVFEAPSGGRRSVELELAPGESRVLDLVLDHERRVRGVLVDEAGAPLAGLFVRFTDRLSGALASTTTDDRGQFDVAVPGSGALELCVLEDQWTVLEEELDEPFDAGSAPLRRVLPASVRPSAFLQGRVVEGEGRILVRCAHLPEHRGLWVQPDREGRFATGALPPGELRLSWLGPKGPRALDPGRVEIAAGASRDLGELRARAPGRVELQLQVEHTPAPQILVRSAEGSVVEGAVLDVSEQSTRLGLSLPKGAYTLQVWSAEHAPGTFQFELSEGECRELPVQLLPGVPCELFLEDPCGPHLATLEFLLEDIAGEPLLSTPLEPWLHLPRGGYRLALGLIPGRYRASANLVGHARFEGEFTVEPGGAQEVRLRLK